MAIEGEISKSELKRRLQSMDDWDFEHFVADLWRHQGWDATVEQQSADAGVDIRATTDTPYEQKTLIQAKRYGPNTSVGGPDVQQYSALRQQEPNVDMVVIVTTGSVTRQAEARADELNVKLLDGDDLVNLIAREHAYDLLNSYLDRPIGSSETSEVQDIQTSHDADTSTTSGYEPTFGYYLVWAGGVGWVVFVLGMNPFPTVATLGMGLGWIGIPLGIYVDMADTGRYADKELMQWIYILPALIPVLGLFSGAVYLVTRPSSESTTHQVDPNSHDLGDRDRIIKAVEWVGERRNTGFAKDTAKELRSNQLSSLSAQKLRLAIEAVEEYQADGPTEMSLDDVHEKLIAVWEDKTGSKWR